MPKNIKNLGSISFVPSVAGILITSYIINDIIKGEKREISNEEKLKVLKQHIELAVAEKGEYIAQSLTKDDFHKHKTRMLKLLGF